MIEQFLSEMARYLPHNARLMGCQFRGDPNDDVPGRWRARVIDHPGLIDNGANVYLTVSAMQRNSRGEFRRRKENFAGGLLLMIDDLGDGPGAKHPLSTIERLPPTALIETSPSNFQAVYMFNSLIKDRAQFDSLIRAFIAAEFLGNDPGMAGVNRVFRPPAGINGKAKYKDEHGNPWRVRSVQWSPQRRYAIEELAAAFRLTLTPLRPPPPRGATRSRAESIRAFVAARAALRAAGMIKREEPNMEGWIDIHCPWTATHTNSADNGASIREPAEENGWCGAFRCHHASCAERGWRELTQWIAEESDSVLRMTNENALDWEEYNVD